MSLKFLTIKSTSVGKVYLLDTSENSWSRGDFGSKKEYNAFSVNKILSKIFPNDQLEYDKLGAPFLNGDVKKYISISHAGSCFAIYLSTKAAVGVDVEIEKKQLNKGAAFFLNNDELAISWTNQELYLIWCAKEVYFKLKGGKVKDLNSAVSVLKISDSTVFLKGEDGALSFCYAIMSRMILVYS